MTTDTLELPTIDADMLAAAPAAQPAAVAVIEPKTTDLAKLDLTTVALSQYGDWRSSIKSTKDNLSTLVLDLGTPAKIKEARTLRQRLIGDPLAAARKVAAGVKSKMAQTSKAVGAELEAIETAYTEVDALILPKIEAREQELEREREEKARLERERIARHQSAIARIRAYAEKADSEPGMTSARVAVAISQIEAVPTPTKEAWDEFAVPAADAICWTLERLKLTHERLLRAEQAEAEAAELRRKLAEAEAERREQERQAELRRAAEALAEKTTTQPAQGGGQVDGCRAPESHLDGCSGPVTQDHTSLPASPNTPQQGANRDASAGQSHVAEGSASPTGRGADGPTACGAAPVSSPAGGSPELRAALDNISKMNLAPVIRRGIPITQIETPAPPADEKPTLKLGDINEWLGGPVTTTAAGLALLGIEHSGTDKAAKLYRASDKHRIRLALIEWLEGLK